jgi:NADH:quinone reductase (non-electrogenic)
VAVEVLLLDRNNYHLFTPLLYQVASALLDPGEIARPVRELVRPLHNVEFRQAEITGADLQRRLLLTDHGPLPYDFLVLATGAQTDYFGNAALERYAFGLKGLDEGLALRNRVLARFEASRWAKSAEERRTLLAFAIVGGGPTGVELAGAYAELIRLVLKRDFKDLDMSEVRVILLEAADTLLGAFEPELRAAAKRSLESKGVEVMLGARVADINKDVLTLAGGEEIRASTVIWTAGVRASEVGATLGVEVGKQWRVKVAPTLQVPGHPAAFVIGDLAAATDGDVLLPMLIPVAMQEARRVARTIGDMVHNGGATAFRYRDPGIMATIGRNSGVAQLGPVRLSGFLGWGMWLVVHLVNVVSFRSRILVLINWAWDYLLYDRPVRLIVAAREERRT